MFFAPFLRFPKMFCAKGFLPRSVWRYTRTSQNTSSTKTQSDGDRLWSAFEPIMDNLGIRYAWQREDEAVRMTFEIERT
jgi:hypothetical protein